MAERDGYFNTYLSMLDMNRFKTAERIRAIHTKESLGGIDGGFFADTK
jgi:hypothetical protein